MLKDNRSTAHQQDNFKYDEEGWNPIRRIFADLGLDADALTFEELSIGTIYPGTGERVRQTRGRVSLRGELEVAARLYRMRAKVWPRQTAAQLRKSFQSAHADAVKAHACLERIERLHVLWVNMPDDMIGIERHLKLEKILLPAVSDIESSLAQQLKLLRPYKVEGNRNAAKPALDEYLTELLKLWGRIEADAEMKDGLEARFLRAVTVPVLGIASRARVHAWLHRHKEI